MNELDYDQMRAAAHAAVEQVHREVAARWPEGYTAATLQAIHDYQDARLAELLNTEETHASDQE